MNQAQTQPRSRRGRGLLLSAVTLLVALLALELCARLLGAGAPSWTRPDARLGWSYVPGAHYAFKAAEHCPGWGSRGRINGHGLRDREIGYERAPGIFRILALGDSYTEAFQFPLEETWTKQLERRLNARQDGRTYEVINAGRSGMGTTHECLFYEQEGRRYHPDLVLLLLVPNDFADNTQALALPTAYGPTFELREGRLVLDDSFRLSRGYRARTALAPLKTRSHLLSLMLNAYNQLAARRAQRALLRPARAAPAAPAASAAATLAVGDEANLWLPDPPPLWQDAIAITRAVLDRLAASVRSDQAEFALIEGTTRVEVQPDALARARGEHPELDLDRVAAWLRPVCEARKIPALNLVPLFRAAARQGDRALHGCSENAHDGHWSRDGHTLAAASIADFLDGAGLLRP